jgi:DNA-binding CsgD family transcriptional regulator
MDPTQADVFGREREFETLSALIDGDAPSGAALLEGEPGIGKTTLWRACVAKAKRQGLRVLASSPASGETRLSFSVLTDLLAEPLPELADELPKPQQRALELALLLEEPTGEGAQQRTVFAAALTALRALAARGSVLLAIDDMQWVDESSAGAIAFAIRRLGDAPIAMLGARRRDREDDEQAEIEAALEQRHGRALRRVTLGPLSISAMHDAIAERFGLTFAPSVMQRIHETSGGNPFYAFELARALTERSAPLEPGGELPVPETLQQIVGRRLDALSGDAKDVLTVVALLSLPTGGLLDAAGVGGALGECLEAGVLEQYGPGRVRFVHPVFASTVSARLAPTARRAWHARLAEVVEGEERARHLALAASGPSAEVADELQSAVHEAASRGAIGTAAELAEQSIRLTPTDQVDVLRQRRLDTATFEVRHGDTERARAHLEPLLDELPAGPERAGVLLQLARLNESKAVLALSLSERAIDEAGPADRRAAAAHQLAAEMSMLSGNIPAALDHAREACKTAEAAGDRALLIESLGTLCHYQTYTGTVEPGLLERAVDLERQQVRPSNNYSPREILGLRLMYADRLDEGRALLETSLVTATELGDELDRGSLLIHLTQLECRAGRLSIAEQHARDVTIMHEEAGWGIAAARFVSALVDGHLGRSTRARAEAEEGAAIAAQGGSRVFHVLNLWALGFLELSRGDYPGADRHLRALPELVDSMGYANPGVRPVHADAIEARIAAGDLEIEELIDDLETRGRAFDNPTVRASAARCRGLLHAAKGNADAAVAELERAVLESQLSPQPLERARTLLALGTAQRRAKHRRQARETLARALEMFDNLGTPWWAERAAAELARIPGRTQGSGELTATEQRVADLVAQGMSNKEVAASLFISVRTVEASLSSIYAKLGVRSRSELARNFRGSET